MMMMIWITIGFEMSIDWSMFFQRFWVLLLLLRRRRLEVVVVFFVFFFPNRPSVARSPVGVTSDDLPTTSPSFLRVPKP